MGLVINTPDSRFSEVNLRREAEKRELCFDLVFKGLDGTGLIHSPLSPNFQTAGLVKVEDVKRR